MAWARLRRRPGDPSCAVLGSSQVLTAEQTLLGYTRDAWRAVGEEAHAGRISAGMRADLTGFAFDPVDCLADDLPGLPVRLTVVAGDPIVHILASS
jgi:predicted amidohydrolase YtcJ